MELQHGNVQLSYKERKSLGFYIMAMLITKLGGSYTINSIKGQGTHLCFTIPELKE
jgi:sensor histidine kinase regulating citrate/malate metabolism